MIFGMIRQTQAQKVIHSLTEHTAQKINRLNKGISQTLFFCRVKQIIKKPRSEILKLGMCDILQSAYESRVSSSLFLSIQLDEERGCELLLLPLQMVGCDQNVYSQYCIEKHEFSRKWADYQCQSMFCSVWLDSKSMYMITCLKKYKILFSSVAYPICCGYKDFI